jgi:hypothetical protein
MKNSHHNRGSKVKSPASFFSHGIASRTHCGLNILDKKHPGPGTFAFWQMNIALERV